jgi:hypothetical protein
VKAVSNLIDDPVTSRTVSYLLIGSQTCSEALNRYSAIVSAVVAVVGCGGIGSLAAVILAGAGVKRLRLIDKDSIELNNLNRQLFYTIQDIGRPKVDVLAKAIQSRFTNVCVETSCTDVNDSDGDLLFKDCTAGIVTVDEPLGLAANIRRWAGGNKLKLVTALYSNKNAVVSLASEARESDVGYRKWIRLPSTIAPSFGPLNAELAGLATTVLLHALMGDLGRVHETGWSLFGFPRQYEHSST